MKIQHKIAVYAHNQNCLLKKLAILCLKSKEKENQINLLIRKRRNRFRNMMHQKMYQNYLASALSQKRQVWAYKRHGQFWEKDIPSCTNEFFKESFRMSRSCFDLLCSKLTALKAKETNYRKSIPLEKRVAIALYTLKSSAEYSTIANLFGVSKARVCCILKSFCSEVWKTMAPEYLPQQFITQEKVTECVNGFNKMGFPQCFGALDGCHIEVRPPAHEAADYYNYKGWYSTVLLALVDYRYRFMYINVGCTGRCNDSGIFERSALKQKLNNELLLNNTININGIDVPVVILGDSAFRLSESLMKPYPFHISSSEREKNFNYVLSKCRRVVENGFGHLKARFRRIGKGLDNHIKHVNMIIKCCVVLHNFLNEHNDIINEKWIIVQKESEKAQNRPQPNRQDYEYDVNRRGEEIREALSSYINGQ